MNIDALKNEGFSDSNIAFMVAVAQDYPTLMQFYDPYLGNFSFDNSAVIVHMPLILAFLKTYQNYCLIFRPDVEETYYLTENEIE